MTRSGVPESGVDLPAVDPAPWWVSPASWIARRLPAGRYPFIHHVCPRPNRRFWASLPAALGGSMFLCDLRDSISREACLTGQYEPQETTLLRALLKPGMTVVDVGANWGYHTLLAAHLVGRGGRVISVEPDPRLFGTLSLNIARNGLGHVSARQIAAADAPGRLRLLGYDPSDGNYGVSQLAVDDGGGDDAFLVEARDLDGLLADMDVPHVDVMKMDVEGAEALALPGLERMLKTGGIRRLLLELHPAALAARGTRPETVLAGLTAHRYRVWSLDHSREMSRRVAYGRVATLDELLKPADADAINGSWPHLLLTAPGVAF